MLFIRIIILGIILLFFVVCIICKYIFTDFYNYFCGNNRNTKGNFYVSFYYRLSLNHPIVTVNMLTLLNLKLLLSSMILLNLNLITKNKIKNMSFQYKIVRFFLC